MIVVTGNTDVCVSLRPRWGKDRVENGDRAPVGEEMPLLVVRRGMLAEIELVIDALSECHVVGGGRGRDLTGEAWGQRLKVVCNAKCLVVILDRRKMLTGF